MTCVNVKKSKTYTITDLRAKNILNLLSILIMQISSTNIVFNF